MTKFLFSLKFWLIFSFCLFCVYVIFRFIESIKQNLWIKEIKKRHLLIKKPKKFKKKYGQKVFYNEFKAFITTIDFRKLPERPAWFELYDREKIIFFEIPWGEIYCECNSDEYNELIKDIETRFNRSLTEF